jgi:cobalt/nickel transport system permease protein
LFTSLEIWLSGNAQLQVIITAMLGVHALIGIGEALITVAALSFIFRTRPDLLDEKSESEKGGIGWVVAGVLITLIVVLLSPLASADPDGLERVAEDLGFLNLSTPPPYAILPDYTLPLLGKTPLSTILAGAIGARVVGVVIVLLGRALKVKV